VPDTKVWYSAEKYMPCLSRYMKISFWKIFLRQTAIQISVAMYHRKFVCECRSDFRKSKGDVPWQQPWPHCCARVCFNKISHRTCRSIQRWTHHCTGGCLVTQFGWKLQSCLLALCLRSMLPEATLFITYWRNSKMFQIILKRTCLKSLTTLPFAWATAQTRFVETTAVVGIVLTNASIRCTSWITATLVLGFTGLTCKIAELEVSYFW